MIYGILSYFNGMPTLPVTLKWNSLWFDKILCFDGAYESFIRSKENWQSSDGSTEYLKGLDNTEVIEIPQQPTQIAKRNLIFNYCFEQLNFDDYLFIIDCDELICGNVEHWRKYLKVNKPPIVAFAIRQLEGLISQPEYPRCFLNATHFQWTHMLYAIKSTKYGMLNNQRWNHFGTSFILNMNRCYEEEYHKQAEDFYERRRLYWARGGVA